VTGVQVNIVLGIIKWGKKGQTLDVIHMGVGKEKIRIQDVSLLQHDPFSQGTDTSTGINDDSFTTTGNFKAGCIATILGSI
jgi:hypothetical protein